MERITADWLPDDAPWRKIKKDALIKKCARRKLPVDGSQSALQQRLLNYQQANITEVRQTSWRVNPSGPDETDYKRSGKQPLPIRGVYYVSNSRGGFTMVFIFGHPRPFGGFSNVPVYFNNKPTARVRYPAALALEKHFERPQVSPAVAIPEPVPTSGLVPVSIKASPGSHRLVTDAIQPSVEAASSNSMQQRTAPQEPQSAAPQRCTSTPLPGNPAQIWLER
ncbi:hypothetical protein SMACR_09333 [Sordaria macrospora]|uniref:WGS project CABT00000000 data, contig 2.85 n=2 Tax=Sordaria macrospora TaxID=5147 RepID=F7WBU7_SORMK|nr:uncharacterized protein SMAC_09333 [Sordaria macrospora k-hell]KAA8624183.1 hypothetical protein SMACR_09333 [Sordaria macrospora]WPJ61307.1 hypothetical protein SMAC4_09333 [Sordaria macrospora]CCC14490.1 unnamed protein product [Sordaria macrospora k-hell]